MPPPPATLADCTAFLAALRAANVLTPTQFEKARVLAVSSADTAAEAAAALVGASLLTRFQADRLLAGRTDGFVIGPHVILEQIGRGAASRVYKARHRTMNRPVALKVLSADLTRAPADRDAFQRGVRAAGRLAHPNVVTAYDAGELHDRFYLVLEFVDGPNLESLVRQRGPLPAAEACEFARQAALGLQHAHEKGMVHGAIKPANLLVARPTPSAPLTLKIADFGVPKGGRLAPEFAAPELFAPHAAADARADLYALGCVFYFLLTGRPPVAGAPLAQLRPDVPPEVAAVVHRLLAKNPAARFTSAAELLAHLDAACVPAALPVEGAVCFELAAYPLRPGHDSGFLTGRAPRPEPASGAFGLPDAEPSPWSQLTDEVAGDGDTVPLELENTPHAPRPRRAAPPGRGGVPAWVAALMLTGSLILCLAGVAWLVKLLAK